MDRIKRKKPEFRRIAAMIMAAAMIISVIPFPEGLFHVTAAAVNYGTAGYALFHGYFHFPPFFSPV